MADLEERLRVVERVPVPDVWERAAARSHDVPSRGSLPDPSPHGHQRFAAAAVALVVAVAGIALVVRAFGGAEDRIAEPSPAPVSDLDATSWVLTMIDGEPAVRGTEDSWMTLSFGDGTYTAESGCNRVGGSYDLDSGALRSTDLAEWVTCGPGLSSNEQAFFDALVARSGAAVHGATLTLDADEHQLWFVQDPCSLLTPEEVSEAVGGEVKASALVPPSGLKAPSLGPVCSHTVVPLTPFSSISVHVETSTLQQFEAEAAADEADLMDIAGVGDRAYISGMNSILVFDADRKIEIGLQHGAGDAAIPVLEALGLAAVGASGGEGSQTFQRFFFEARGIGGVLEVATSPPSVCYSTQSSPRRPIDVITRSGGVVLSVATDADARPFFCDRAVDAQLAKDLIDHAADFRIRWKPDPAGPWEVSTLTAQRLGRVASGGAAVACPRASLRFGPAEVGAEPMPPRPYGVAIVVSVRSVASAPCVIRGELAVSIVDGEGVHVPVRGDNVLRLHPGMSEDTGSAPGSLMAVWRLADWCRPVGSGPHAIELRFEESFVSRTAAPVLDSLCTEQHNVGEPTQPRPPEGRYSPSVAPLP